MFSGWVLLNFENYERTWHWIVRYFLQVTIVGVTSPSIFISSQDSSRLSSEFLHLEVRINKMWCSFSRTWWTVWRRWGSSSPRGRTCRVECSAWWWEGWGRGPSRGRRTAGGCWGRWRVLCWNTWPWCTFTITSHGHSCSIPHNFPEYDGDEAADRPESFPSQVTVDEDGAHWRLEKINFEVVNMDWEQPTYRRRHWNWQEDSWR